MPPGASPPRVLGFWAAVSIVIGNMIGSGVFLLPASLAAYRGLSLVGWVVSAAGSVMLALVFARLARQVPAGGGPYDVHPARIRRRAGLSGGVGLLAVGCRHAGCARGRSCRLSRSVSCRRSSPYAGSRRCGGHRDHLGGHRHQRRRSRTSGARADCDRRAEDSPPRGGRSRGARVHQPRSVHDAGHQREACRDAGDGCDHAHALGVSRPRVRHDSGNERARTGAHDSARHDRRHAPDRAHLHRLDRWRDEPRAI